MSEGSKPVGMGMWPTTRKRAFDSAMRIARARACRTVCAFCGELVAEGEHDEGNELFMDHLAKDHPDRYPGIAAAEAKRRAKREASHYRKAAA